MGGVGGEGRGERFSVWSCSRSARAVSPGSSHRRETFPETRAHTARTPAHPRSPAHTHAHTQPGGAGATDRSASAGTSRGAVGTNIPACSSQSGAFVLEKGRQRGRRWARTRTRRRALAGPPCLAEPPPGTGAGLRRE